MSQTGSTFSSAGGPSYNLSQAQFQQRTATAFRQCKKCKKGPGSTRFCKALIDAKFHRCPAEGRCGEFREDSCQLAAAAALAGCPTKPCVESDCGKCPCKECQDHDDDSYHHCCSEPDSEVV